MAYVERKTNALANLNTALAISTTIQTLNTQTATQQTQATNLQNQIQIIKSQTADVQLSMETSEKAFVDKKGAYNGPKKIQTLQDLVLAFFFLSYIILSIILLFIYYKTNKNMAATGIATFVALMFGILLEELVRRFA